MATLPKFQRARGTQPIGPGALARLEENVATYAAALTDERRGLLAHGLTFEDHFRGCVLTLTGVEVPDDWTSLASNLQNSWTVVSGSGRPTPAIRKSRDGAVQLRGSLGRAAAPAAGSSILTWPAGYIPEGRQTFGFATDSGPGAAESTTTDYLYYSGGVVTYPLDEVRFMAADRTPLAWPAASQVTARLPEAFHGEAGQVLVLDAVDEDSGIHTAGASATWATTTVGGKSALLFSRFDGLTVGRTYSLTLAVLSA